MKIDNTTPDTTENEISEQPNNIEQQTTAEQQPVAEQQDVASAAIVRPDAPRVNPPEWMDQKEYQKAPFVFESGNEDVGMNTGSLSLTYQDLVLPGKNGFDLAFTREFDSSKCNTEDVNLNYDASDHSRWFSVVYRALWDHRGVLIDGSLEVEDSYYNWKSKSEMTQSIRDSYGDDPVWHEDDGTTGDGRGYYSGYAWTVADTMEFLKTGKRPNNHFVHLYGLGYGWRFAFPSIETIEETPEYKNTRAHYRTFLHLSDGRSFSVNQNFVDGTSHPFYPTATASNFDDYQLMDTYVRKVGGLLVVYYKDGREVHFDSNKKLAYMCDKFDNRITFGYDSTGRMTTVTDTFGRVFLMALVNNTLTIKRQDTGAIECSYAVEGGQLRTFTDKVGRVTTYGYMPQTVSTEMNRSESSEDVSVILTFNNLTSVLYPTGGKTQYAYSVMSHRYPTPYEGIRSFYVMQNRKDFPDASDPTSVCSERHYTFASAEKSKPQRDSNGNLVYGPQDFGAPYINTSTFFSHKNAAGAFERRIVNQFTEESLRKQSDTYHTVAGVEKLVDTQVFTYSNQLPTKIVETVKNTSNQSTVKTTTNTYSADKKGNILMQADTCAGDDYSCDQTITYLYDANYSIPLEQSVRKDNVTFTVARFVLKAEADGKPKVVEFKRVFEKGDVETLKEKTKYEYDSRHRMTAERRYFGDNLEATTTCVTNTHSFTDSMLIDAPTTMETSGIVDADGNLIASPSGAGVVRKSFTYDWYGRLIGKTDPNGNTSTTEYDAIGRAVKETNPDGTFKTTALNDTANQITATNELGVSRRTEYTSLGKIKKVFMLEPQTLMLEYRYDSQGRLLNEITYDSSGTARATAVYAYDLYDQPLSKTVTGSGVNTQETTTYDYAYQNKYVRVVKTLVGDTNAPAVVTETLQDPRGRTVKEIVGTSITEFTYNNADSKLTQTNPRNAIYKTRWTYDYAGRVTSLDNALRDVMLTSYDALGNKVSVTDAKGNVTNFTYDFLGRLLKQDTPFVDELRAVTKQFYDAVGNVIQKKVLYWQRTATMGFYHETAYTYDSRNRLIDTIMLDSTAEEVDRSRTVYDSVGNKLTQYAGMIGDSIDGAAKTSYTYGRFGNVLTFVDALNNTRIPGSANYHTETYAYDNTELLQSKTDRNGNTTAYTYDALNRVLTETVTVGSTTLTTTHTYTKTGQKLSVSNANLTVTNKYDAHGRLIQQTESNGITKVFGYDEAGNRTTFTLTRNNTQEINLGYTYSRIDQLATVTRNGSTLALYGYDANGNRTSMEYPQSHMLINCSYNDSNLITLLRNRFEDPNTGALSVMSSFEYEYDLDGNQTRKADYNDVVVTYAYDALGRLFDETEGENWTAYEYDRFSNRTQMRVYGPYEYTVDYTYAMGNQLVSEANTHGVNTDTTTYLYDDNGNQLTKTAVDSTETRVYNGLNQLVSVTLGGSTTVYAYRPDGLRRSKTTGASTHTHLWDGQNIVAEVGPTNTVTARFLRGINLIACEQDNALQYYTFNAHGDVVGRYDGNGNLLVNYKYDAFGNETAMDELDSNPFRYCGEYFDEETGEIYLRARYYNPATGRFSVEDSARSGLNWYSYCGENPIGFIDPTGRYDHKAAADYAVTYGKEGYYNNNYMPMDSIGFAIQYFINYGAFTGLADCTNFTSQALFAGGIQTNDDWHYYATLNQPNMGLTAATLPWINPEGIPTNQIYDYDFTSKWVNASAQYQYFSNTENGYSNETFTINPKTRKQDMLNAIKAGIQPGDLMYWDWDVTAKKHDVTHATMISRIEGTSIYYAAHSNHRQYGLMRDVWKESPNARAYIVKMNSNAK